MAPVSAGRRLLAFSVDWLLVVPLWDGMLYAPARERRQPML
jgi:hypothetical protein